VFDVKEGELAPGYPGSARLRVPLTAREGSLLQYQAEAHDQSMSIFTNILLQLFSLLYRVSILVGNGIFFFTVLTFFCDPDPLYAGLFRSTISLSKHFSVSSYLI
jgi:hypothetical protein